MPSIQRGGETPYPGVCDSSGANRARRQEKIYRIRDGLSGKETGGNVSCSYHEATVSVEPMHSEVIGVGEGRSKRGI